MITGRDQLSQEIIKDLTDKTIKVKDVPKRYDVSLDQAKRLWGFLPIPSKRYIKDLFHKRKCL